MRHVVAKRTDWKKPANYLQPVKHLERFIGRDMPLEAFTEGDAERFHRWLIHDPKGARNFTPERPATTSRRPGNSCGKRSNTD